MILKPLKRTASTRPRKESEFPPPHDLQLLVPDLKLAPPAPVVTPRTKAEIPASATHVLGNATVSGAVEHAAEAEVRAAGKDEKGAGRLPGFFEESVFAEGGYGVVGGEEAAEGVEAVFDGFDGGAGSLVKMSFSKREYGGIASEGCASIDDN